MADFPASIYDQRALENYPGEVFDATKTRRLYAEDMVQLGDEITAIESTLGLNPQGTYSTVVERLDAGGAGAGGGLAASWFLS